MGKPYRECPDCGAHLDAGESCDCKRKREELVAICREDDKTAGEITVYPIDARVDDQLIEKLGLRASLRPNFRYFVTTAAHFRGFRDVIEEVLGREEVTADDVKLIGGLVEL